MTATESGTGKVLVAASQLVLTLDHGPVAAADLPSLGTFTALSYDSQLFRYAAVEASAADAGAVSTVVVDAEGSRFTLVAPELLKLSDGTQTQASELAPELRLFGVSVDHDEEGHPRVHLRDGLKGKSRLADLATLPPDPQEGARTPVGIKSDRLVAVASDGGSQPAIRVGTAGPANLIIWPDRAPVGHGVLVGV